MNRLLLDNDDENLLLDNDDENNGNWVPRFFYDIADNDQISSPFGWDSSGDNDSLIHDRMTGEDFTDSAQLYGDIKPTPARAESNKQHQEYEPLNLERERSDQSHGELGGASEQIAKEFNAMSLEEKGQVFEDLHGVAQPDLENPSFLKAKLDEMDIELESIADKEAYNMAHANKPSYVRDRGLWLKFLRCTRYKTSLAAHRLVEWFQLKLECFGPTLLTEDITMLDLNSPSRDFLESGTVQLVPDRDSAGRTLVVSLKSGPEVFIDAGLVQFFFYFSMVLCEDEATQLAGVVCVEYMCPDCMSEFSPEQHQNQRKIAAATNALPIKFQGFHLLMENMPLLVTLAEKFQLTVSRDMRHRFRKHVGTAQQNQFSLMSFGIPVASLPFTDDGQIKVDAHNKWLKRRESEELLILQKRGESVPVGPCINNSDNKEALPDVSDSPAGRSSPTSKSTLRDQLECDEPSNKDVLLGRGRPFQDHPGNVYLKSLIVEWYDKYNSSPRLGKMAVAEKLVRLINDRNGKFLKKDAEEVWEEVSLSESREKVSHGFRKKRELDLAKGRKTASKKKKVGGQRKRVKGNESKGDTA